MEDVVVMLPTYNEAGNIGRLIPEILAQGDNYRVLVMDDDSPDGTAAIVRRIAQTEPRVELVVRKGPRGRGLAGAEGFRRAVALGADVVVEMDADYSHQPRFLPALVAGTRDHDVVIGSRMVQGGKQVGRPLARKVITSLANLYIRLVLGTRVRDATSGFRAFARRALTAIPLDALISKGPSIVQEILFACELHSLSMVEIPIEFVDREAGSSTFSGSIIRDSLVSIYRLRRRRHQLASPSDMKTPEKS